MSSTSDDKKQNGISRRGFLKWTTALVAGGAAVVGLGAGYGSDLLLRPSAEKTTTETIVSTSTQTANPTATQTVTTTSIQQPVSLSYVPPLSPQVQSAVDSLVANLQQKRAGETIIYENCGQNGCFTRCIMRAHVKNGVVTAIETDDTINTNIGREDAYIASNAPDQGMIQNRGCVRGQGFRRELYAPTRLTYPMKNVGQRGSPTWVRITWDDALNTIVSRMQSVISKYGLYSISGTGGGIRGVPDYSLVPWIGAGTNAWGMSSYSGDEVPELTFYGYEFQKYVDGTSYPTFFNSKAIILWGWDPAVTGQEFRYFLPLAKEKGIPFIAIEPRYSMSVETLADQWIPIRPSTDMVALLAIANVLFKENLWNQTYVTATVEPTGFQKWKDYVLGNTAGPDGAIDRTPEWAAPICGIPAQTLKELARFFASHTPLHLRIHWSVNRENYGENTSRAGMYILAMLGSIGVPGGFTGGSAKGIPSIVGFPADDYKRVAGTFSPPVQMNNHAFSPSIVLRPKLNSGEMTEDLYRRTIGCPTGVPLPNTQMIFIEANSPLNGKADINNNIQALKMVDTVVATLWHSNQPAGWYADILLPAAHAIFETNKGFVSTSYGSATFLENWFMYCGKVVDPPGEAHDSNWIYTKLAQKLGFADKYNPLYNAVPDTQWDQVTENVHKAAYVAWTQKADIAPLNPPSWDDFKKKPVWRIPLTKYYIAFADQIAGKTKFNTPSGKLEFYSAFMADPNMATKALQPPNASHGRGLGGSVPPTATPMAEWVPPPFGYFSPTAKTYPLLVTTGHSYYRQHGAGDNNPWFRDEFRHACWISVSDAKARGIVDGDTVRVFNDRAEMILPAYVTSRMVPGNVVVKFGAWYEPSGEKTALMPDGIDMRGAANFLTHAQWYPGILGPVPCTSLVEVQKFSTTVTTTGGSSGA